ncbi:SusD/RagB family nutrient-binding outer membrane lipoprotein [Adhaeribacter aquaticus]|uniref:SusD/RagB family nutrient-binding outer membrane lipoprotein n=1 Tax=Adhaeribacter aquaticus TaxID=299567 RepID=UPI000408A4EE|nr:SusD/RagB family nutrient-binding outer membrane lipoprotein [Adhaeribacter aquaticus]
MKKIYISFALAVLLAGASSCDKDFEQINTSPVLAQSTNPLYLFTGAQFNGSNYPLHHYGPQIVQHFHTPFTGTLEGGNHNVNVDQNSSETFNALFANPIRSLVTIIEMTKGNPLQINLNSMARILKAYYYMELVDTYGDVAYFNAGQGFATGNWTPALDDQKAIYEDPTRGILFELQDATDKLNTNTSNSAPGGGTAGNHDIFFRGNVGQWRRLGNSLLLRAGMRYTELDQNKAKAVIAVALKPDRGGVMTSNTDNAKVSFFAPSFNNPVSQALTGSERANYYAGQPLVNFFKANNDPRAQYIVVKYSDAGSAGGGTMTTTLSEQVGAPVGFTQGNLPAPPAGGYSRLRRNTVLDQSAPIYYVTYAQTQLLLADATQRGFLGAPDPVAAKNYYETGIKAHMDQMRDYNANIVNITDAQKAAYLMQTGDPTNSDPVARVGVLYDLTNAEKALEQINTQYWVASFGSWYEAWSNFRRTEYPRLTPMNYSGADPSTTPNSPAKGFIRRLQYPNRELSVNAASVNEAIKRMGGNNLGTRIFWDKL